MKDCLLRLMACLWQLMIPVGSWCGVWMAAAPQSDTEKAVAIARSMKDLDAQLAEWFGNWVMHPVIGKLAISRLALFLAALLVLALLVRLVRMTLALLQRLARRRAGSSKQYGLLWQVLEMTLDAASPPLRAGVAAYGLVMAVVPVMFVNSGRRLALHAHELLSDLAHLAELVAVLWFLFRLAERVNGHLGQWAQQQSNVTRRYVLPYVAHSMQLGIPVLGVFLAMRILALPENLEPVLRDMAAMLLIGTIGWILIRGTTTIEAMVKGRFSGQGSSIEAKRAQTRVTVLNRLAVTVIAIVTIGAMLMVFERVRAIGASLLASAGIAGVIIGFSSQRLLANLLAGFQIAISEPVRIGDAVIVEGGEFGTIEEITLTYVVVRCWDLRRLVLPISYFIEKPFQNWSRSSTELLGTVMLYLDYMAPIETIRQALKDIVSRSTLWDGRVVGLQVTDAREQVIEVRCLVSATDSGKTFDLRCEVREQLVAFIRSFCPEALPRVRGMVQGVDSIVDPVVMGHAESMRPSPMLHDRVSGDGGGREA